MGKTFEKKGARPPRPDQPLATKPMAGAFKGMRVGPECLECKGPIDAREAFSLPHPRGSRKAQRHGFLHPDCELAAAKRYADRTPGQLARMEVPVYDEAAIQEILKSKGVGA
jgi:hypothetical protein